jgi:hypothetical protein
MRVRLFAMTRAFESVDPTLRALLRKRAEIYTWLDGPAKQAFLAQINRTIEQYRDSTRTAA